jgi:hypothetical protein
MLPPLPDGTYTFRCLLQDEHGNQPDRNEHAELRCTISLPDPSTPQAWREVARLRAMSHAELLREYEAAGTVVRPTDAKRIGMAVPGVEDERQRRWGRAESEVIRRGSAVVPELMEFLKREVPRNADDRDAGTRFGFARPLMEALTRIRDPRCVPLLVDILDGYGGKANRPLRGAALTALRELTYTALDDPHQGYYPDAVEHPSAAPRKQGLSGALYYADQAARYREWLAGEGREPSQWLPLARQRARKLLDGDDLEAAYYAASFLLAEWGSRGFPRDDDSSRTLARLGDIIENTRAVRVAETGKVRYEYRGKPLSLIGNWTLFLTRFGPRARPYVKTLLQLYPRDPEWWDEALGQIGGEEAMAYLVPLLGRFDRRLAAAGIDRRADWDDVKDEKLRHLLIAHNTCRWAVHRWAGRTFPHTPDVLKWWDTNASKTQEQWLREGLDATAAAADAGDFESQYLLRLMLPDLPESEGEPHWCPPPSQCLNYQRKPDQPFRVNWLRENRARLRYDADAGAFRVRAG